MTNPQQQSALSPERRKLFTLLLQQAGVDIAQPQPIPRRGAVETLPLSFAQQRLWFFDQLEPGSSAYNMSIAVRLTGQLDRAALQHSIDAIIRRHEILRTTFPARDEQPAQVIAPTLVLALTQIDLRDQPVSQRAALAERRASQDVQQPFDLARGPLLRTTLLRLDESEYLFLLTIHHIVSDGWSLGIFVRELAALYTAFVSGQPAELPELPIQYADFALWQRAWLQGTASADQPSPLQTQLDYWRGALAGAPPLLELPLDRPRPAVQSYQGTRQSFVLRAALSEALHALSRQAGATMFMVLLAALQTLLYRYSGQTDIVVSTGIANRKRRETEPLIGCLINILLLRGDLSGDPRFSDLLDQMRQVVLDAQTHQDLPFEKLVEALQPQRDPSYTPLAQVMFVLHNAPMASLTIPGLTLTPVTTERAAAQYDLLLHMVEGPSELIGALEYNTTIFEPATILRLLRHFQVLLSAIAADPTQSLAALPLLTPAEHQHILVEWNATHASFPQHATLHDLIAAQAARCPDAIALVADASQLSFAALHARASELAHILRAFGVAPNRCVAICLPRTPDLLVALLAVLAAGAAYLPLDPTYPPARLTFMLKDAQPTLLLTHTALADRLPATALPLLCLDQLTPTPSTGGSRAAAPATPSDLLYLIYTSGSTGTPKGVLLDQRGRLNNFSDFARRFAIGPNDRLLALAALSFDMAAFDLLGTLAAGAAVVLPSPDAAKDPAHWYALLHRLRVSIWHSAPALLDLLLDHCAASVDTPPLRALRLALLGGDWIPLAQPERLRAIAPQVALISLGGATELSMDSTVYVVGARDPAWTSIPYGRPLTNQQAYVLDQHMRPVPIGIPGDLYLGGVGLAWGYHQRPDLTAARFVPNPFADFGFWILDFGLNPIQNPKSKIQNGERLYFTGDRARYGPDGLLELLGRSDHQIKLHGLRIEPGEIAAVLTSHPAVQRAVVVARATATGPRALVAYVVMTMDESRDARSCVSAIDLRAFLAERLPAYLVPSAFVQLSALPLTPNGKLDRAALPEPALPVTAQAEAVAPRTPTEQRLAQIWARVLGQPTVGIDDNFFELGGDSFAAIRVLQQYGPGLTLLELFTHPTIRALARQLAVPAAAEAPLLATLRRPAGTPARTLVCIPYAGGSAVVYQPLAAALPADHALYAVELPGHDLARQDEPLERLPALVPRCVAAIQATVRGPLVLYGHCGGVALTLALARALEDAGVPLTAVCVAGALPLRRTRLGNFFPRLALWRPRDAEARLRAYMQALGGFDDVVDPVELGFVLRSFRHDGEEAGAYFQSVYAERPKRLRAPIVCIVGDQDPLTRGYARRYEEWQRWSAVVRLAVVAGGKHYFVKQQAAQVAQIIGALPELLADG